MSPYIRQLLLQILLVPLRLSDTYLYFLRKISPRVAAEWKEAVSLEVAVTTAEVSHSSQGGSASMQFLVPNALCRYRVDTFSSKEPETLEWIEQYGGNGTFFDVGANIGLYSIYYAKLHPGKVFAFEPSSLNLSLLTRNIALNGLEDRIVVVPIPLTSNVHVGSFNHSMMDEGGSMSSFGTDLGHDGRPLPTSFRYQTPGAPLDWMLSTELVPATPSLLKIDVDGIEHLILQGAESTLALHSLQSVLIEVNDDFTELSTETSDILLRSGFRLKEKRHSSMFDGGKFSRTFNQIWIRE